MKKKAIIINTLALIGILTIIVGTSIAVFNYSKEGTGLNTITSGNLIFTYDEVDGIGKGIALENAMPILDSQGKAQTGLGNVFEFKVSASSASSVAIPYEITLRRSGDDIGSSIKVYLTKVVGNTEEELVLSKFSSLTPTSKVDSNTYDERVVYTGMVPVNTSNYSETYRLRMWVDNEADFSDGSLNDKLFKLTVNMYANQRSINSSSTFLASEIEYQNLNTTSCTGNNSTVDCAVREIQTLLSN